MRKILLALLAVLVSAGSALANNFPSRPVTIIVPFSAGGPSDAMARILAERLKVSLVETVLGTSQGRAVRSASAARCAHLLTAIP